MIEEIGVGATDPVSTDTPQETAQIPVNEEVQTVNAGEDTDVQTEATDDIDLAEGADDAEKEAVQKLEPALARHFRKVIASQKAEIARLASQPETDREAAEFYQGLTSFDNEKGVPTTRPFAERLAAKDPALALQTIVDLASLAAPGDENGWTFGHHFLKANGIDPNRLNDVREFLESGHKATYQDIPEYVPTEYHDAYKSYSQAARESLEYQLASDDPNEKQAALEVLQDRQYRFDQRKAKETEQAELQAKTVKEIQLETETETVNTFSKFVEDFQSSPTYTNVQVSSDPVVDKVVKSSINQLMLNMAEPNTVAGRQALGLLKEIGVDVNMPEIEQCLNIINGSIETSIKAGKGGYQANKAQADASKQAALVRLGGIRNSIFSQALKKIASGQQQASEGQVPTNQGLPNFGSPSAIDSNRKESTLDYIKRIASKP
jgi:hypothetical protein